MSDPRPGSERPYQTDDEWSRVVFGRRTGEVAGFLTPHLRAGMRLIDCGCGPGSITVDLAEILAQGEAIGIDLRESAVAEARMLARTRGIANVRFEVASVSRPGPRLTLLEHIAHAKLAPDPLHVDRLALVA